MQSRLYTLSDAQSAWLAYANKDGLQMIVIGGDTNLGKREGGSQPEDGHTGWLSNLQLVILQFMPTKWSMSNGRSCCAKV